MVLNNIKLAVLAGLVAITLSTSYLSYTFYGKLQVLELRYDHVQQDLRDKDLQLTQMEASCKIDQQVVVKVADESASLSDDLDTILETLNELTLKEVRENVQPARTEPKRIPAESGVLTAVVPSTDAVQRLLDDAYCAADPVSSYCTTRATVEAKAD